MFFRVTRLNPNTRQPKFPPQSSISNHQDGVPSSKNKELRPNSELIKGDLRKHHILAPSIVPRPKNLLSRQNLDETTILQSTQLSQLGNGAVKKSVVNEIERMKRYAVLGEESEEGVGGVVDEGVSDEAASGGD